MRNPRRFGGHANAYLLPEARKGNVLYAGEAAGFQDALFGFGMRFAMLSGALAASALLDGAPQAYDRLWKGRLRGLLHTGLVNRFLFERLGDAGYVRYITHVTRHLDGRAFLRKHCAGVVEVAAIPRGTPTRAAAHRSTADHGGRLRLHLLPLCATARRDGTMCGVTAALGPREMIRESFKRWICI
jgi:flavin-dependent dehydrogenase